MPLQKLFVCAHAEWDRGADALTAKGRRQSENLAKLIVWNTRESVPTIFLSPRRRILQMMDCMRPIIGNAIEEQHDCFEHSLDRQGDPDECIRLMKAATATVLIVIMSPCFASEIACRFSEEQFGVSQIALLDKGEFLYLGPDGTMKKYNTVP